MEHNNIMGNPKIKEKPYLPKNNHYVQIYTTHRKHSHPFDPNYTHTPQSKNLTTSHNTLL